MGENIIIYDSSIDQTTSAGQSEAQHLGGRAIGVTSIDSFKTELKKLKDNGVKIANMVTVTHGGSGNIWLGQEPLNGDTVSITLTGQGFDDLFDPGGHIFIKGCWIAATGEPGSGIYDGRELLKALARVFLQKGGGRVGGSDSVGVNFFGGRMYQPFGMIIYAYINRGGTKIRIAVGGEVGDPGGKWKVRSNSQTYIYTFFPPNFVDWAEDHLLNAKGGKGSYQNIGDVLRISWETGSIEEWDLPLHSLEETGVLRVSGGQTYSVMARYTPVETAEHRRFRYR